MKTEANLKKLTNQYEQLIVSYPGLECGIDEKQDCFFIAGVLRFSASFAGKDVQDSYLIRMDVPWDFDVLHVPLSYELAGRIPRTFHHHLNGNLCLGVFIAIYEKLNQDCTLLGYVNNLLVPYLFAYSCYEKTGEMPFGNAGHDKDAMLLYLKERLGNIHANRLLDFIVYMYMPQVYGSHRPCLCGSGLPLRDCHLKQVRELTDIYPKIMLRYDIKDCINQLLEQKIYCESMIPSKWRKYFCREINRDFATDKATFAKLYGKEST